jgi:uncharacterized protein (UPF0332 family)
MKKQSFFRKLRDEGKLGPVEPSGEIKESYLSKADNCLKSAKILQKSGLYENAMSEAYYAMYDSLLALLYMVGIKSENHSASIIMLKRLFGEEEMSMTISSAKKERIDKQYYVVSEQQSAATKESCAAMVRDAEDFMVGIRLLCGRMNADGIKAVRTRLRDMLIK